MTISLDAANALESAIDGKIRQAATPRRRASGTVSRVDKDGTVYAVLESGIETVVEGLTASVSPGDTVSVTVEDGHAEVLGNYTDPSAGVAYVRKVEGIATEAGETANAAVDSAAAARQVADEANKVAEATNQHFFADTNGAHITDVTQDEWAEAVDDNFSDYDPTTKPYHNQLFFADTNGAHITDVTQDEWAQAVADNFSDYDPTTKPYHNQLLNSLGILLRTALNNLVSITRSAIAFYDGAGNAASNIVARFGSTGAQIGKSSDCVTIDNDSFTITNNGTETLSVSGVETQYLKNGAIDFIPSGLTSEPHLSINGGWTDLGGGLKDASIMITVRMPRTTGASVEVYSDSNNENYVKFDCDIKTTGAVNLSHTLTTQTYTKAYTAAANSLSGAITINISKTGYTPLGIVGFACGSSGAAMEQASISGTTATLYIRNVTSSAISKDCTINVLYTAVV